MRLHDTRLAFGSSTALVGSVLTPSYRRHTAEGARPPVGPNPDNLVSHILAPQNRTCSYLLQEVRESFLVHVYLPARTQNSAVNKIFASERTCGRFYANHRMCHPHMFSTVRLPEAPASMRSRHGTRPQFSVG
jgi:hypothetical protein